MSSFRKVLCVGINPAKRDTPESKNAGPSDEIRRMISSQIQDANDAGFDLHVELLAPDEMAEKVPYVRELLEHEHCDGYIVGGGIRKEFQLTKYFEQLVNAGRETRPQARIGFNTSPGDLVITMQRMFAK